MTRKGPYGLKTFSKAPETLGQRIAAIRKAWRWTQEDIARQLRIKTAAVSAWERGKALPSGASLTSLAALLNTTPEVLEGKSVFVVPEQPQRVAEPSWTAYRLPTPSKEDQVMLIQAGSLVGSVEPKTLAKLASEAIRSGASVWLVIGAPEATG